MSADFQPAGGCLTIALGSIATGVAIGDSIALDGCCLTVVSLQGESARFDVAPETLSRTALGNLRAGGRVNLERALRIGDRLDGHLVTGHIDGVGRVTRVERLGIQIDLDIELPPAARRYVVEKGSITLNGVSLTIAKLLDHGLRVMLIPHTAAVTNLGALEVGYAVAYELDAIGKWVERLVAPYADVSRRSS